jgi:hypothetical protein
LLLSYRHSQEYYGVLLFWSDASLFHSSLPPLSALEGTFSEESHGIFHFEIELMRFRWHPGNGG